MRHIGFLIPASNIVAERELYTRLIKDNITDISFHFARLKFTTPYGQDQEQYTRELVDNIPKALATMERIPLYKTAVLCTSAGVFIKEETDLLFPIPAIISYFKYLKKSKPILITPYSESIGRLVTQELRQGGIKVVKELHLYIKNKEDLMRFTYLNLIKLIAEEIDSSVDSICLLCTNFASLALETDIENKFNLPLISSNKSIYWSVIQ